MPRSNLSLQLEGHRLGIESSADEFAHDLALAPFRVSGANPGPREVACQIAQLGPPVEPLGGRHSPVDLELDLPYLGRSIVGGHFRIVSRTTGGSP